MPLNRRKMPQKRKIRVKNAILQGRRTSHTALLGFEAPIGGSFSNPIIILRSTRMQGGYVISINKFEYSYKVFFKSISITN